MWASSESVARPSGFAPHCCYYFLQLRPRQWIPGWGFPALITLHGMTNSAFVKTAALAICRLAPAMASQTATAVDADFQTNYLSYWTDNGAYYYYLSENNK